MIAYNADHSHFTDWAYVGVFVSKADEDRYVENNNGTKTPQKMAPEPGIRAGFGTSTTDELRGFLSFNTGVLGATTTILGATLRMNQATDNAGFDVLGPCKVDIKKGAFNGNVALSGSDFGAAATHTDVMRVTPLAMGQTSPAWTATELRALYKDDINTDSTVNMGRTQVAAQFIQWHDA